VGPVVSGPPVGSAVRVTLTVRETRAAPSVDVTVMRFNPIASGMLNMLQFTPLTDAPSDAPVLVIHVTTAAPVPPDMVPERLIVANVVVAGGVLIPRTSGPGIVLRRVTLTVCETLAVASAAVTVMVFNPIASGMLAMVQVMPLIDDPSDAAVLVTHVTAGAPLPPVTVPERVIVAEVVVAAMGLTVRTSGPGVVVLKRVTLTVCETLPVASVADTAILFRPIARGILEADQFAPLSEAVPD